MPLFPWVPALGSEILKDDENAEKVTADEFVQLDDWLTEPDQSAPDGIGRSEFERINERLNAIEGRLETIPTGTESETGLTRLVVGPELAHMIIHASITSDLLTEEEEL